MKTFLNVTIYIVFVTTCIDMNAQSKTDSINMHQLIHSSLNLKLPHPNMIKINTEAELKNTKDFCRKLGAFKYSLQSNSRSK